MDSSSSDAITRILSDPESLKTLAALAKGFLSGNSGSPEKEATAKGQETPPEKAVEAKPEDKLLSEAPPELKLQQTINPIEALSAGTGKISGTSSHAFDDRANLLRSLKPYLKGGRLDKVDSLVKAIGVAKLINTYTGGNLFSK